jgi:hypothetical protein
MTEVVECQPSKKETLSSNPRTAKKSSIKSSHSKYTTTEYNFTQSKHIEIKLEK